MHNKLFPEGFYTEPEPKELHLNKITKEIGFIFSMRNCLIHIRVFYYRLLTRFTDMVNASEYTKHGAVICEIIKNLPKLKPC